MIPPHAPAYPLPPMDEEPWFECDLCGDEHPLSIMDERENGLLTCPGCADFETPEQAFGLDPQAAYHAHRIEYARQLAEAGLGRPYPAERHAVWPR